MNAFDPEGVLAQRCNDRPAGLYTVATDLRHFAIVTYAIPPDRLRPHLPDEFPPHLVQIGGEDRALVSVVPFLDRDFHFIGFPLARWSFGQTNYRIYVRHRGEECVWFLGTSLATALVQIPRQLWQLPWLPARTRFDAHFDDRAGRYQKYIVQTTGPAAAEIELKDLGATPELLQGFDRLDEQELVIFHPTRGYFRRRDGRLGTYRIWHDRLRPSVGKVIRARYRFLEDLGILTSAEALQPYSVVLQRDVPFLIGLPPRCVALSAAG